MNFFRKKVPKKSATRKVFRKLTKPFLGMKLKKTEKLTFQIYFL